MGNPIASICIKKGREKPVSNHHPWIFSGAIAKIDGNNPDPGDLVEILSSDGGWLARGYYNPYSQIRARILTWDVEDEINSSFWRTRIKKAISFRDALKLEPETTAYRLINAESDLLPGLIVDKYGDYLVIQCLTAGIDLRKGEIINILVQLLNPQGIYERSDILVRKKEGLKKEAGLLWGSSPPKYVKVHENGHLFQVDIRSGHKTGLYLDQRDSRATVCKPKYLLGKEVLNVFAYTGGFAIYSIHAGAKSVTNIDDSDELLKNAEDNVKINGYDRSQDEYVPGDAFEVLRRYRDSGRQFDAIILDPPKFASSQKDIKSASRGYKDLNWLAFRLLRSGGFLATFSCSGRIDADLFQKIIFSASIDAGRDAQIIKVLGQASDHPVLLSFPQSAYLKGLFCRVI